MPTELVALAYNDVKVDHLAATRCAVISDTECDHDASCAIWLQLVRAMMVEVVCQLNLQHM